MVQLSCLTSVDVPEKLRELFASVEIYLTRRVAKGDEGAITATAEMLCDEDAMKIAKAVVELSYELEDWPTE